MASYIQAMFQKLSMPKRLLYHVLSQQDILDTDALDLDKVQLSIGRINVLKFENVGLKLKKLEALLQLPSSFEITKARVLLLQITVPVDLYNSPIIVEVDGVECQLRLKERTDHDRKRKRASGKLSGAHGGRRGSNSRGTDAPNSGIPTAADLAESFVQSEPLQERAELEAAILSEAQDPGTASVFSDDGDELGIGMGTPLSLPGFIAGFLQGVIDRLQVKIRGITVNLDIDIPSENPATSNLISDHVTAQLKIANIDVEGVWHAAEPASTSSVPHKRGKRLVHLSEIRGALISEANLFSSLSRSSAASSPAATNSRSFEDRKSYRSHSSSPQSRYKSLDSQSPLTSIASLRESSASSSLANSRNIVPLQASVTLSDTGRFDDAPEEEESSKPYESLLTSSEVGESVYQNSAYLDQIGDSQFLDDADISEQTPATISGYLEDREDLQASKSSFSTPTASIHVAASSPDDQVESPTIDSSPELGPQSMLQSTILPQRPHSRFSQGRISQSQVSLPSGEPKEDDHSELVAEEDTTRANADTNRIDDDVESPDPLPEDDKLAQSQLFSHEEAESMYMSAISKNSVVGKMPGGWGNSSDGSDDTAGSPNPSKTTSHSTDNIQRSLINESTVLPQETTAYASPLNEPVSIPSASESSTTKSIPNVSRISSDLSEQSVTSSESGNKLAKHVFRLENIALYLPSSSKSSESSEDQERDPFLSSVSKSEVNDLPSSFSTHLPQQKGPAFSAKTRDEAPSEPATNPDSSSIHVEAGEVSLHFDVSVGRLVWKLVHRIQESLKDDRRESTTEQKSENPNRLNLKLRVQDIFVNFLETLEGLPASPIPPSWIRPSDRDVLLRTSFTGLNAQMQSVQSKVESTIKLKKFVLGYATESILSFDASYQLAVSKRDIRASDGIDIVVKIVQSDNGTHLDINTLPMHVAIDLQRLDETFSWFGGLSGVLNLGSSIVSNATIVAPTPGKAKARSVRFETPNNLQDQAGVRTKIDLRVGGLILELLGRQCTVGIESSAIRSVVRGETLGLVIDTINLSGPHLNDSNEVPAIDVEILNTRMEYLPSPKDRDLDALLSLITPSKAKYDQDDDILLDTLLRQRRQGSVLRLKFDDIHTRVTQLDKLSYLPELAEELSRLSTVAKYLPEDDRPGLLSLVQIKHIDADIDIQQGIGTIQLEASDVDAAQITLPALVALSVNSLSIRRNQTEELVGVATDPLLRDAKSRAPAIMARMIGDEMEPIVKVKLWNVKAEYRVGTLIAILDSIAGRAAENFPEAMATSVATVTDLTRSAILSSGPKSRETKTSGKPSPKPLTIDIIFRDCIVGLNPLGLPSKALIVLTDAHLSLVLPKDNRSSISGELDKASLLLIDDTANVVDGARASKPRRLSYDGGSNQVADLCASGFVSVSYISSASAKVQLATDEDGQSSVDVELRDDLFVLETCADSTQTLIAVLSGLSPPTPPSTEVKYRTKIVPVEDLLASLSGDAFGTAEGNYDIDDDFGDLGIGEASGGDDMDEFDFESNYYQNLHDTYEDDNESDLASSGITTRDVNDAVMVESLADLRQADADDAESLDFEENYFGTASVAGNTALKWNSAKNRYEQTKISTTSKSPLKVRVRDVHMIWNLFDGYDWQNTRDTITKAVQEVESKAISRKARNDRRSTFDEDIDDDESVIDDFLFNSIYIGIPGNRDPGQLVGAINQEICGDATETESIATTTVSSSPSRQGVPRTPKLKGLRLKRSKRHKITFELSGVCVDMMAFPLGSGETQSSIDVRVRDLEIFDHIATSTWLKFATYMAEAGEREAGSNMIHLEILTVKPQPDLAASDLVLKVTVLPLRLHVDQDALDFITRFFEFKDDSVVPSTNPSTPPFIQRAQIFSIPVKLDFKPKRVDYKGLRSGHKTELMNFVILDGADLVLVHTILYGVSGFDKLGRQLNDIWTLNVTNTQLPGVLAGLAPVRPIVNLGSGIRNLVNTPLLEYKKDSRVGRAITKGLGRALKTTATEAIKTGAKVFIGTQAYLQYAEGVLSPSADQPSYGDEEDDAREENNQISPYANQPVGVREGLQSAQVGLARDLRLFRDAVIAMPGEVMEGGGNAGAMVGAVRKLGPTLILRPAIGVTKAGGRILMGATNALDPKNLDRADAKYKKH